nr:phage major tail protein 2 [uncultured Mediterranean phage uvMED]BAR24954.1 phage major tail protein 2 [uncultured Mediterranean phage uvMED]BAR39207.1 phage major tail protein 2 [uncultured Mediterranean phage uvMED]BAR39257.1 phage major tail protein 2 [uncultured Mediterranean phage uvMED]
MGFFTGRTGSLVFNSKPVAKIRDWSLETTVELLSTNTIDSSVNTFVPGVKGATGSATLMYYKLETGENATLTQFTELLSKIMKTGAITTSEKVLLELNVGAGNTDDIKFNAYITSASISVSTGELSVVPINFTVDGDFTEVIS